MTTDLGVCCLKNYDAMHVTAVVPNYAKSYGLISPAVYRLFHYDSGGGDDYYYWDSTAELGDNGWQPDHFYTTRTETTTYLNGYKETVVYQRWPFFSNPANLQQTAIDAESDTFLGTDAPSTDSLNPADDLRLTGFPTGAEETHKTTRENPPNLDENTWIDGWRTPGSRGAPPGTTNEINRCTKEESEDYPPLYDGDSSVTHYLVGYYNPTIYVPNVDDPTPVPAVTRVIAYSGKVMWSDFIASLQSLLDSVGLSRNAVVTTREGNLYFDYFGTSACAGLVSNQVPSGATYDQHGEYTFSVAAKQLFGIQVGANEASLDGGGVGSYPPLFNDSDDTAFVWGAYDGVGSASGAGGQPWPYHWQDDSYPTSGYPTLKHPVKIPNWIASANQYNAVAGDYPDTCAFVSKSGSVQLHGGGWRSLTPWAANTAYTVGAVVTNVPGWTATPKIANSLKMVCTAVTGDATSGATEPTWGVTAGATISDHNVTWKVVGLAPVTARVTPPHVNCLTIFPVRGVGAGGAPIAVPVITAQSPNYTNQLAGHLNPSTRTAGLGSWPWEGFCFQKSRVKVPKFDVGSPPTDVTCFHDLAHVYLPQNFISCHFSAGGYFDSDNKIAAFLTTVPAGEYQFQPSNVETFAFYGWLQFDDSSSVDYP
jgi:hypothetical protein